VESSGQGRKVLVTSLPERGAALLDPTVVPEPEPVDPRTDLPPEPTSLGRLARARTWSEGAIAQGVDWTNQARQTHRTIDVGFLAADRDRRVAAAVLAGGLAYRIFFWILAMSLLANGALGLVDSNALEEKLEAQGVDPSLAASMQQATQGSTTFNWWLLLVGIWLVLWTGYLGAKTLVLVHAAVWGIPPPRVRSRMRMSLVFTGGAVALALSVAGARWVRDSLPQFGVLATLGVIAVPFTLWLLASSRLPHQGVGWAGLVPGAAVLAVGVEGIHVFTVYFLGPKLVNATELYGLVGVVSTVLFWFYLIGRLVIGAATLNASLYEQDAHAEPTAVPDQPPPATPAV
jgi:uncharacterized BrkB/YihY/UPF0761 family membrane protein